MFLSNISAVTALPPYDGPLGSLKSSHNYFWESPRGVSWAFPVTMAEFQLSLTFPVLSIVVASS